MYMVYMVNMQKSNVFLFARNKHVDTEIKKFN